MFQFSFWHHNASVQEGVSLASSRKWEWQWTVVMVIRPKQSTVTAGLL
jgi:hypothetical protein